MEGVRADVSSSYWLVSLLAGLWACCQLGVFFFSICYFWLLFVLTWAEKLVLSEFWASSSFRDRRGDLISMNLSSLEKNHKSKKTTKKTSPSKMLLADESRHNTA